jgi:hypothetical protein
MTMHLVGPYLTTTRYNNKKKKSVRQLKADAEHAEWLKKRGVDRATIQAKVEKEKPRAEMPKYEYTKIQYSNVIGSGTQSGVMANLHKEPAHVQKAILDKASRVMPLYNKGGLQYCTPETDLKTVGTKSRRG